MPKTIEECKKIREIQCLDDEQTSIKFDSATVNVSLKGIIDCIVSDLIRTGGISNAVDLVKYIDILVEDYEFSNACYDHFKLQRYADEETIIESHESKIITKCEKIRNKSNHYIGEVDNLVSEILERLEKLKTIEGADKIIDKLVKEANIKSPHAYDNRDEEDVPF